MLQQNGSYSNLYYFLLTKCCGERNAQRVHWRQFGTVVCSKIKIGNLTRWTVFYERIFLTMAPINEITASFSYIDAPFWLR